MSNESIHPSLYPDLYEASISELNQGLNSGQFSSVDLTKAYLARIDEVNSELRAVLETNPRVLSQAAALDAERSKRGSRGPLHGIPVLIKDNLATDPADGMQTTAGSYALLNSNSPRAAHVVSSLSAAGALILGKTSLSEWSNFRGKVPSGWCARGGQGKNPYVRDADPSGSSSGSAIAAAVGLAAACVGSETDGSIVSPSRRCNIVGLKPTVGLTSRDGCIPISFTQDSIGPMGRCVTDVAFLLNAMAGPDQRDSYSLNQPTPMPDYTAFLKSDALRGARIGVPRALMPPADQLECDIEMFENALKNLRSLGATIVDNVRMPSDGVLGHEGRWLLLPSESRVLETEFRHGIEKYIAELIEVPTKIRTVDDIITFNNQHADKELIQPHYADQRRFISSAKLSMDDEYHRSVKEGYRLGRTDGIDHAIAEYNLDALVLPSDANCSTIAAIAGYPIITVPLGFKSDGALTTHVGPLIDVAPGLPLGLAFFGCAWSEAKLLGYAYAFEQETKVRGLRQPYEEAMPRTNLKDIMDAEK